MAKLPEKPAQKEITEDASEKEEVSADVETEENNETVVENGETSLTVKDVMEIEEFSSERALKNLEARMDYMEQSRRLVLKKLKKAKSWIKYENKKAGTVSYRLRKGAVSKMLTPFGINSRIISVTQTEKPDGSVDYQAIAEMSFSAFPDYFLQRSGTVNSTEVFYESQVKADQKYGSKKFGEGSSVPRNLSQNCKQQAVTRAMTNTFSAIVGIEDIDNEEMQEAGIDYTKILSPYGKSER